MNRRLQKARFETDLDFKRENLKGLQGTQFWYLVEDVSKAWMSGSVKKNNFSCKKRERKAR